MTITSNFMSTFAPLAIGSLLIALEIAILFPYVVDPI